jgi:hypothetical protein
MKYVAYWLGAAATLTIVLLLAVGGIKLIELISADTSLVWVPLAILGILALSTLVAVVEYLSDKRTPEEPGVGQ